MKKVFAFSLILIICVVSFSFICFADDFSYDDRDSAFSYSSRSVITFVNAYNATLSSVSYQGSISFDFYGGSIELYACSYTNSGTASVYIDGLYWGDTDSLGTSSSYSFPVKVFYDYDLPSDGKHSCTIVSTQQYVQPPTGNVTSGRFYFDRAVFSRSLDVTSVYYNLIIGLLGMVALLIILYNSIQFVLWRLTKND